MADFKLRAPPRLRTSAVTSIAGVFNTGGSVALTGSAAASAQAIAALLRGVNLAGSGSASAQAAAALLKGIRLQGSAQATASVEATLSGGSFPDDVATVGVTSVVGGADVAFAFGHAFRDGDIQTADFISTTTPGVSSLRAHVLNRWPGGSVKFAVIAGRATLSAGVEKLIAIRRITSDPGGTAVAIADLKSAMSGQTCSIGYGAYGTASWSGTDWDSPFLWKGGTTEADAAFLRTSVMSSWLYRKPIGSDQHLVGWLEVRIYASGAVEVLPWIENGFLTVASPGERSGTATFTLGALQRFSASVTLRHHTRAVLCSGTVFSHWLGADPGLSWRHNVSYLSATRLVAKYRANVAAGSSFWSGVVTSHQPGDTGNYRPGDTMPDTGYHGSIGPLPAWEVSYLAGNADLRAWRSVQANGYIAANRFGTHYRDQATHRPLRFSSFPIKTLNPSNSGVQAMGTSSDPTPAPGGTAPDVWQIAHSPSVGYAAYLLTGRFFYMEETQFVATVNYLHAGDHATLGRDGAKGLIRPSQSAWENRGAAWGIRALTHAACVTPDADTNLRAEFIASLQYNIDDWHNEYIVNAWSALGLAKFSDTNITPWRDDWINVSFHWLRDLKVYGNNLTKLNEFLNYKAKSIIGRLGGQGTDQYCYRDAAIYDAPPSLVSAANWGVFYSSIFGTNQCSIGGTALRGSSGSDPAAMPTGYWGNLHPGIAYAVDLESDSGGVLCAGAAAGYTRLTGASNYASSAAGFDDNPVWGYVPRNPPAITALAQAAAQIGVGQCIRMSTGLTGAILNPTGWTNSILAYCGGAYWDPTRREVGFIGKSATASNRYWWLLHNEVAGSWSTSSRDPWDTGNQNGHGYDHNTVDPATGTVYHRVYGTAVVQRWNGGPWSALPTMSPQTIPAGTLTWFPGVGLVYADGYRIRYYNGSAWVEIATLAVDTYHDQGEYNAAANCVMFGLGNTSPLRRLNSNLTVTSGLAQPGVSYSAADGVICSDTGTDNIFGYNNASGAFKRYTISGDSWTNMTKSTGSGATPQNGMPNLTASDQFDVTAVPIPEYGVTMWIQYLGGGSTLAGVWLYRHA